MLSVDCDFTFFDSQGIQITKIPSSHYFNLCNVDEMYLGSNNDYMFRSGNTITSIDRMYFNLGCTDSLAINYDSLSFIDDNNCFYDIHGCMDSTFIEYNTNATVDDGSCITPIIFGCMDSSYIEFNELANKSDNSCQLIWSSAYSILNIEHQLLSSSYDSLQYLTDSLNLSVFDLQNKLQVPDINLDMAIGWNMIGYSCPVGKDVELALENIVDKVIIFKDNNGRVFMPEYGFNGIGSLESGHGYQLKISDYVLDYNICE